MSRWPGKGKLLQLVVWVILSALVLYWGWSSSPVLAWLAGANVGLALAEYADVLYRERLRIEDEFELRKAVNELVETMKRMLP